MKRPARKKRIKISVKTTILPKKKARKKVERVLEEFKEGTLRSGSFKGPKVTKKSQALAIALSEARKPSSKKRK